MGNDVRAILFDLGGVLVELDGPPLLPEWLDEEISLQENKRRWAQSASVEAFEKGEIKADRFVEGLIRELNLNVSPEVFTERFLRWPANLYPGALNLLEDLRSKTLLALYSNTSELHWPRMMDEFSLRGYFDHHFASFLIGYYKPDVASFNYVANKMQLPEQNILFLDDSAANVEAARKAGMQSVQVQGVEGVKAVLPRFL